MCAHMWQHTRACVDWHLPALPESEAERKQRIADEEAASIVSQLEQRSGSVPADDRYGVDGRSLTVGSEAEAAASEAHGSAPPGVPYVRRAYSDPSERGARRAAAAAFQRGERRFARAASFSSHPLL